jgi:HK97 family phage major capsid protein
MSDYDNFISAGNVDLRPEYLSEIFTAAAEQSAVLSLGRKLRNMTTNELKLKVSTALPEVYFVGTKGDTKNTYPTSSGLKKTTKSEWEDKTIYVGELAAIVVIPNNVFNDADFDVFGELRRQLPTAIAQKVDEAVLYGEPGVDVPDDWEDGIFEGMPGENIIDVGHVGDTYDDILGEGGVFAQVEADGYDVNGIVAAVTLKAALRGLRADTGDGAPIFTPMPQDASRYVLGGVPMVFPRNGGFDASETLMIAGDWDKLVYSIRQDVTFDVFTTGVVQDETGAITHNLMQEDLTALRVTFRMAWGLPLPAQWDTTVSGTAYPFSAYIP